MNRYLLSVAVLIATGVVLLAPATGQAARTGTVTCTDAFSGTARDVIVPDDNFCVLSGATVTHDVLIGVDAGAGAGGDTPAGLTVGHDVILQHDSEVDFGPLGTVGIGHDLVATASDSLRIERATIRHDLLAFEPGTVQTDTLQVGHNLLVEGTPPGKAFVFDSVCGASVGHDLSFLNRSVTLGFSIGDEEACAGNGAGTNTVGHDLIVSGNSALSGFFGPSSLDVGNNSVGHDLVFSNNTAVPGGYLEVSDNTAGHDALCSGNDPAPSPDDPADGPNSAKHLNTCG